MKKSGHKKFSICAQHGFTLIEIVIVMIIVMTLAGLSLPRLFSVLERFRASEAEQTLLSLYAAQKRYHAETDTYANAVNLLDIDLRALDLFNAPVFSNVTATTFTMTMDRMDGLTKLYDLSVDQDAQVTCANDINSWCSKIKY